MTPNETPSAEHYDDEDGTNVCLLCENPDFSLHYEINRFGFPLRFFRCQCRLIKQAPMPNETFFEWFFNSDLFLSAKQSNSEEIWGFYDYLKDEPCRLATSRFRYWRLRRHFGSKTSRIMKIGPSTGTMLHVAKQKGHDANGCDVSSTFVAYAREHYDVTIDQGRFEQMGYETESFDSVLLFNVIENVNNLSDLLDDIHRTLRDGGRFILNHVRMEGNLIERFQGKNYFLYRPPVCYIFESPVLHRLLEKHGFRIEQTYRDLRFMNLEKVFTLLRWRWPLRIARALHIHLVPFPVYAYPSRILVARKIPAK